MHTTSRLENQVTALRTSGHATAPKSRRPSQNARTRLALQTKFEDALEVIGEIESEAGPTLAAELGRAKRFQAAYTDSNERTKFIKRRLGQRSGLLRLWSLEAVSGGITPNRSAVYLKYMLMISANIAVLTGSGWPSVRTWLGSRMSLTVEEMDRQAADFTIYVSEARNEIARRIPSGDPSIHTGPTPADIAIALGTTTDELRQAKANTCGLTSIDPQDRKARDRERKAAQRLADGVVPQSQRNAKTALKALAKHHGISLSKAYQMRLAGTLDSFIASHGDAETNPSAGIRDIDGGHFGLTNLNIIEEPDLVGAVEPLPATAEGYTGRNLKLTAREFEIQVERYPLLQPDMLEHLTAIDALMSKTTEPYRKRVFRNLIADRNRAVTRGTKSMK